MMSWPLTITGSMETSCFSTGLLVNLFCPDLSAGLPKIIWLEGWSMRQGAATVMPEDLIGAAAITHRAETGGLD